MTLTTSHSHGHTLRRPRRRRAASAAPRRTAPHQPPAMHEQLDVAIVGAGAAGLAAAAALLRVRPSAAVKVYERRSRPAASAGAGGGVRLEVNGLRAAAAISGRLAARLAADGSFAPAVLLHDERGAVLSRIQPQPGAPTPSARQPALVVGWSELESALLEQLPPDTVEWGVEATGFAEGPGGAVVHLAAATDVGAAAAAPDASEAAGKPPPSGGSRGGAAAPAGPPASPFSAAAQAAPPPGGAASPASHPVVASAATMAAWAGGGSMELDAAAATGAAAGRLPARAVRAKLLIAADGAASALRQQCVGDGPPRYEGAVRFAGRLPGDVLATVPVDEEAWWVGAGPLTWTSHPLGNGDVAWEAQVSAACLAQAGVAWNEEAQCLVAAARAATDANSGPTDGDAAAAGDAGRSATAPAWWPLRAGGSNNASDAAPGGDAAAGDAAGAAGAHRSDSAPPQRVDASAQPRPRDASPQRGAVAPAGAPLAAGAAPALLLRLFAAFPVACRDMIAASEPGAILCSAVLTRPGRLPPSLGRGSVVVVGEAAHPSRPTGQEASLALEDGAELGAAVMRHGLTREALRRFELRRRPRWQHALQVSGAYASCSNLGGVALHQGLLDYYSQLYCARFMKLRPAAEVASPPRSRHPLLRWGGAALLAWGGLAGLAAASRAARRSTGGGDGRLPAAADPAARALGAAVDGVGASASALGRQLGVAAGLGSKAVADVAEEAAGVGAPVVHGAAPSGRRGPPAALVRLKDALVGRALAAGVVLSRPFTSFVAHRAKKTAAEALGTF